MKQIPLEFLQMVEKDIKEISSILTCKEHDEVVLKKLHMEIDGKYQACVKDWGKSMYGFNNKFGFCYDLLSKGSLIYNLEIMKSKLIAYKYQVNAVPNMIPPTTNVSVNVDNNIELTLSFEFVRTQIDNNTSLTEEQIKEAKGKIDEIEKIIKSGESKKNKWEKVKPILIWLADKSVDIGTALLPLLLKI